MPTVTLIPDTVEAVEGEGRGEWASEANARLEDGNLATVTLSLEQLAESLVFTFDEAGSLAGVPAAAAITNFNVRVKGSAVDENALVHAQFHDSDTKTAALPAANGFTEISLSPAEWFTVLTTIGDLLEGLTGLTIWVESGAEGVNVAIDAVELVVTYTPASGGGIGSARFHRLLKPA